MAKIKILTDRQGEKFYPVTTSQAVKDSEGNILDDKLNTLELKVDSAVTLEVLDTALENYSTTENTTEEIKDSFRSKFIELWEIIGGRTVGALRPEDSLGYELYDIQLNELEALWVLDYGVSSSFCTKFRDLPMKLICIKSGVPNDRVNLSNFVNNCYWLEKLSLCDYNIPIKVKDITNFVSASYKLREIRGILDVEDAEGLDSMFTDVPELQYITLHKVNRNINLSRCPKLEYYVFDTMLNNLGNHQDYITVTVHPDVYTKFTELTLWKQLAKSFYENKMIIATIEM